MIIDVKRNLKLFRYECENDIFIIEKYINNCDVNFWSDDNKDNWEDDLDLSDLKDFD